jgi:hypothetical protein
MHFMNNIKKRLLDTLKVPGSDLGPKTWDVFRSSQQMKLFLEIWIDRICLLNPLYTPYIF